MKPWQRFLVKRWTKRSTTLRDPADWLLEWLTGTKTVSGERVNETIAMSLSAWFACLRAISEDIAKLDLIMYRRLANGGKERIPEHPLFDMLHDEPNREMGSMVFRETILQHAIAWGGGFAEIQIDEGAAGGLATALWPLDPSTVTLDRDEQGELIYEIQTGNVPKRILRANQVFHVHGLGPQGLTGYNLPRLAREMLGGVLAAQKFGASFFGAGSPSLA